ncbi:MAG: cobalamin-binding protein [Firmicutes bacterium]|jgi:5-methyltetrahydrofolate--homocysteine methyltransferase|nr:cobalamin-binding protein [Bacillota bacterium]
MNILTEISEALQVGDISGVEQGVSTALDNGISPREVLEKGLLEAMEIIGDKFTKNEVFVPEVMLAARAMNAGMTVLKPKLVETGIEPIGKVVIGTVKGDLHDIGKNLVKMMLEGVGFEVIDLGVDVSAEKFLQAVKEHQPDFVGMSSLLTTTMKEMKVCIDTLKEHGLRDQVKVMVGGAPITQEYADSIGADLYAKDAAEAASKAKELIVRTN